jgi:hypothetical protein
LVVEPPEAVRQWFVDAGWYPGRAVRVPSSVPVAHPARAILGGFGGLVIMERDPEPGGDWPPIQELVFRHLRPIPAAARAWGRVLGTCLVGIAGVHNEHGELYVDAAGRCFGSSNMHPAFYFYGASFAEAVEGILLGRRARPMLLPGHRAVILYGEAFTADSPELYRWR